MKLIAVQIHFLLIADKRPQCIGSHHFSSIALQFQAALVAEFHLMGHCHWEYKLFCTISYISNTNIVFFQCPVKQTPAFRGCIPGKKQCYGYLCDWCKGFYHNHQKVTRLRIHLQECWIVTQHVALFVLKVEQHFVGIRTILAAKSKIKSKAVFD